MCHETGNVFLVTYDSEIGELIPAFSHTQADKASVASCAIENEQR